jgi:uncharacterized protein (DUF1015 family)
MAEVLPSQGIRYNSGIITDMAQVVAPPYDVISPKEQIAFHERHPNNVIRLILGRQQPEDDEKNNVHIRAGRFFKQWLADGILKRDDTAAIYLTSVTFETNDTQYTRLGLIARVRLEPFEKGIILPHERTYSKVKTERLMLMKQVHANFSPIFGLYPNGSEILAELSDITRGQTPEVDIIDDKGHLHKLWRLTETSITEKLFAFFQTTPIYIADGHHRYETALNYRDWVRETTSDFTDDHPANFIMMSLSSMIDPGMIVLPAHRLPLEVDADRITLFLENASEYFDRIPVALDQSFNDALAQFDDILTANAGRHAVGIYSRKPSVLQVMALKKGVMQQLFNDEIEPALQDLDVTVLTHLIMMKLLGFDQARLDDATKMSYCTTIKAAAAAVDEGQADLAFVLNPTKIEQVQRVAEQGLIMPRKSTYFYPKVISGLVFNGLR